MSTRYVWQQNNISYSYGNNGTLFNQYSVHSSYLHIYQGNTLKGHFPNGSNQSGFCYVPTSEATQKDEFVPDGITHFVDISSPYFSINGVKGYQVGTSPVRLRIEMAISEQYASYVYIEQGSAYEAVVTRSKGTAAGTVSNASSGAYQLDTSA